ncbi:FdtA/QdtA family cupin domain-containing protein [Adhaeribacter sp. BT258]|uniref:FdtA/QdtA family cupin domain-containing protein n=1 Tax=Adhaeribacter terrigena TaxID=2793070 RepID=A0ABS1BXD6_9BACT|nr:FdtA/QdtA family cupin domain-containing protein [Adhaeribacter terrigena]MBK0401729.1 FdtA/QdtA family cupin domain-containing protein [Adhaeribacter terrigena]
MTQPYLFEFPEIGAPEKGFITVAENLKNIPFEVKRVFWTHSIPAQAIRGNHAHYRNQQILVALQGSVTVITTSPSGEEKSFELHSPDQALYLPPNVWRIMNYSENALQLVLSSELYDETDYIRDISDFQNQWK